jgi:hypothetical protein
MSQQKSSKWWIGAGSAVTVGLLGSLCFHSISLPAKARPETHHQAAATDTAPTAQSAPSTGQLTAVATAPTVASTPQSTQKVAPAGAIVHTVAKGESLPGILHRYLPETTFMTGSELEAAVRSANPDLPKGLFPKAGTEIIIPNYQKMPWTEHSVPLDKDFEVRAIYLTGTMAGSAKGLEIIRQWRASSGNAVVFDIKDSDGSVSVPIDTPLAPKQNSVPLRNLAKFTHFVHQNDMKAIARIAIFRDELLVKNHPELAIRSHRNGKAWLENGKLVWTDPSSREIWDYNIALAKFAAQNGADEVQFDYVRFPAEGDQADAHFAYQDEHKDWQRSDVIVAFLDKAHMAMKQQGVLFSLDVFGVMAWQRPVDLSHTGQDIARMAKVCDVMSPMIYPSHFYGMDGYTMPGDAPEHFISESMKRFQKTTAGTGVVIRPWLQAFGWRTKTYSPEYIRVQVETAKQTGGNGFLFWNARNDYSKPYAAMPEMKQAGAKYFRGDDVETVLKKMKAGATTTVGGANPPAGQ